GESQDTGGSLVPSERSKLPPGPIYEREKIDPAPLDGEPLVEQVGEQRADDIRHRPKRRHNDRDTGQRERGGEAGELVEVDQQCAPPRFARREEGETAIPERSRRGDVAGKPQLGEPPALPEAIVGGVVAGKP